MWSEVLPDRQSPDKFVCDVYICMGADTTHDYGCVQILNAGKIESLRPWVRGSVKCRGGAQERRRNAVYEVIYCNISVRAVCGRTYK